MSFIPKRALTALAATALVGAVATSTMAAEEKKINIGWTAWSDAETITKIAATVMEDRLGYDVELILADIALQYQGVEQGDLDLMMMAWLPDTHADFYKKVAGKVIDLGPMYTGAKLGWVVPNYIPEDQVKTIADLQKPEVAEKLDRKIQGIDPGAGLMRLSDEAIKTYGLNYELVSASDAAMMVALDRAIKRKKWIVITGWRPHWMFSAYDLRYLEDPEGALGGGLERVHTIARMGLDREHPKLFAFLSRFSIPLEELQAVIAEAEKTAYEDAVAKYIEEHPARMNYWVTGEIKD